MADLALRLRLDISYDDDGPPELQAIEADPAAYAGGVTAGVVGLWAFKDNGTLFDLSASGGLGQVPGRPQFVFESVTALWHVAPILYGSSAPVLRLEAMQLTLF